MAVADSTGTIAGSEIVTKDTATNLEWLDLTVTDGCSVNQVNANTCNSQDLSGWTHATYTQVFTLWDNAGIPDIRPPDFISNTVANHDPIEDLLTDFLGFTIGTDTAQGYYDDSDFPPAGDSNAANLGIAQLQLRSGTTGNAQFFVDSFGPANASGNNGHYLVREMQMLPEPGALTILGLGLAGLDALRRKKAA